MENIDFDKVNNFKDYCCEKHDEIGQMFADKPYSYHIKSVFCFAKKFIHLIPECDQEDVLMASLAHDLFEDTTITYNKLLKNANVKIAEIVFCCTDEKGRNRKERKNKKFFKELKSNENAVFVKICDRTSNVYHGKDKKTNHYKMYKKESKKFKDELYICGKFNFLQKVKNYFITPKSKFDEMWNYLENL